MRKALLCCFGLLIFFTSSAQNEVTGKITDEQTGLPVAGATVIVKGEKTGTISQTDGSFIITAQASSKILTISVIGYADKEVLITGNNISIALTPTSNALSEVLVVGYGTSTKRKLTGNIAKVKGGDIENIPVPNFTQALQGRAAGVFVESESGKVGEGVKIRIRGTGSLTATNDPLYVIDGIPINSNNTYSGNALADINFNDIESFDILKDASAKAIYGSRGSNGVVIITTKKGKAGKTNFEANTQYGFNKPTHLRGFLNGPQYVELLLEAANNTDVIDGYDFNDPDSWTVYAEQTLDDLSGYADWRKGEINTDWQKLAFNDNAHTYSGDISASGGTDKTKFYVGLNYDNQDGIIIGNYFRRISGRINLEHNVSDKFKLGFNLSISRTRAARLPFDNEFSNPLQIVALAPITPVRDKHGQLYNEPVTTYSNPLVDVEHSHFNSISFRNLGGIYGQYNFTPYLFFKTEFGIDVLNQNDDSYYGPETVNGNGINGYGESDWFKSLVYNSNNYFTFKKTFNEKHDLDATVGMDYEYYSDDYANVKGQDFPTEDLQKLASAGTITGGTSVSNAKSVVGYFGRINYVFNEKYIVYASGRIDGSSVFGKNNRYGFFPAASAGWILSEENFLKNSKTVSFLKLRASYGESGNDDIDYFVHLNTYQGVSYGGSSGLAPLQLGNNDLRWEKDQEFDVGVEFGFLKNRLTGELDFYRRKTTDLLYDVLVPSNSGFTHQIKNVGSMQNTGVELVLNSTNINSKTFKWNTSFNLSFNKNEILKLNGTSKVIPSESSRYLNSLVIGESIGVFYGPRFAGVDPENGDALYYKQDGKTTTNNYNSAGNFVVGDPNPDAFAGITNNFSYKGIELNILFQGVFGNQVTNGGGTFMTASFDYFDNQTSDQLNRWQKPGDITDVPQLRLYGGNGIGASSRYVYDASYVRLKNITLSYTLPVNITKRFGVQSLRVYVSGVNLATFTDYPGWDPEVNTDYRSGNVNQGGDFYTPPQIKNYSFGLNLQF
jgi:TonB-linked SusC/RagA family outer membrane protein